MKTKGFTLAEVLITLAIIGVIAAISVPSLIQKTNSEELKVAFKKDYAMIGQAVNQIMFDKGSFSNMCPDDANKYNYLSNIFQGYLKTIKSCPSGTVSGNCWSAPGEWYTGDGDPYKAGDAWVTGPLATWSGVILNNGSFMAISYSPTCPTLFPSGEHGCGGFMLDTNGFKKPNKVSKDIFLLYIDTSGTVVPCGPSMDITGTAVCNTATQNGSFQCTEDRLIGKGW